MLDILFLKKLSKKGKIAYWLIQIGLDIVFIASLFLFFDFTMDKLLSDDGRLVLFGGIIVSVLISGLICLIYYKEEEEVKETE